MRKPLVAVFLVYCFSVASLAHAQTLNQEMTGLAEKISRALVAQGFKNLAAVDFTDLQGQPTELGRFLSERLTVEIVSASNGVSMLDRANIKSILAEHKLTEEGLVNPANAKKLGEFAGVDAILIGNATSLDSGIELLVKAVATESSKLVAAGRITFPKTSDIQLLLNRGISSSGNSAPTPATVGSSSSASYQDANAIATKDIGSLRVVLKSVLPIKQKDSRGRTVNVMMCSFDFINRETQRPLIVAMNSQVPMYSNRNAELLRSTLVDEQGGQWRASTLGAGGVGIVGVGWRYFNGPTFNPTEVASLLERQDQTKTNLTVDINPVQFIFGSMSPIGPGQTTSVTVNFAQDLSAETPNILPKFFQIDLEIVVGTVTGEKKSYSLQNLTFDRVNIPAF